MDVVTLVCVTVAVAIGLHGLGGAARMVGHPADAEGLRRLRRVAVATAMAVLAAAQPALGAAAWASLVRGVALGALVEAADRLPLTGVIAAALVVVVISVLVEKMPADLAALLQVCAPVPAVHLVWLVAAAPLWGQAPAYPPFLRRAVAFVVVCSVIRHWLWAPSAFLAHLIRHDCRWAILLVFLCAVVLGAHGMRVMHVAIHLAQ